MDKKEFYEQKADTYVGFDRQGRRRYERASKLVEIQNGQRVLDAGCKHAYLLDILLKGGIDADYYGTDISEKVIGSLTSKKGTFLVCDLLKELPFETGFFDYVFCLEVIEHVENPTLLLHNFHRVLKDGGRLIVSSPNPYNLLRMYCNLVKVPTNEGHIQSFPYQEMENILKFTGFKIEKRIGTYCLIPYTLHGVKKGNYVMFPTSSTFLSESFIFIKRKIFFND
jgi:2-polyprenyl-3-methyl-5-hydroxy-6-metoxy-1,4-benzoquinol methylase